MPKNFQPLCQLQIFLSPRLGSKNSLLVRLLEPSGQLLLSSHILMLLCCCTLWLIDLGNGFPPSSNDRTLTKEMHKIPLYPHCARWLRFTLVNLTTDNEASLMLIFWVELLWILCCLVCKGKKHFWAWECWAFQSTSSKIICYWWWFHANIHVYILNKYVWWSCNKQSRFFKRSCVKKNKVISPACSIWVCDKLVFSMGFFIDSFCSL